MESTLQEEGKLRSRKQKLHGGIPKRTADGNFGEVAGNSAEIPSRNIIAKAPTIPESGSDIIPLIILTVFSGITRLWRLGFPPFIVFDELFYSRFIHMYINRLFHFDSNPPFAKQLISLMGYLAGYGTQNETFEKIGDAYSEDTPIWALRFIPALFGSLLIPFSYTIIRQFGYSRIPAALTGICFLFDNALVTGSRFVLTDPVNLCLLLVAVLSVLKFIMETPLTFRSYTWGLSSGLFMGLAISTKYTSFNSLLILAWIIIRHYWKTIDDLTIKATKLLKYLAVCCSVVFVIPIAVYMGCFLLHLTWLTKAGPYDAIMSTRFQSSLEGGMDAIALGQPYNIAHGSQITLRSVPGVNGQACWLHSHKSMYPIKYPENGRGSSHQQQVTCYRFKDVNNWWIVKNPNKPSLEVDQPPEMVKNGDIVQLVHGITGRNLNSHDVAAPMTPECQEVSSYVDYNISMPAMDLWQVRVLGQDSDDPIWHTIQSNVHLIHMGTQPAALSLTGIHLPAWGFNQWEVVSCETHEQFTSSLWIVEEHRYTPSTNIDEMDMEQELYKAEFMPDKPFEMSVWKKFLELQGTMLGLTKDTVEEHFYGSGPSEWIRNDNGVAYWADKVTNRQIYQVGNVVIWQTGTIVIILTVISLVILELWNLRYPESFPVSLFEWNRILFTSEILLISWVVNWMLYFFTDRTLFFHHYYPGLAFKYLLLGSFVGELMDHFHDKHTAQNIIKALLGVWTLSVCYNFYLFIPLTYGFKELTTAELRDLEWRETWNFIIRE